MGGGWMQAWRALLLVLCLGLLGQPARAALTELREAQAMVTVDGNVSQGKVALPYMWDREHQGQGGEAAFDIYFELPVETSEPYAVFLPRVGNTFEVWLNGSLLLRNGDLRVGGRADFAKTPHFVSIPPQLLEHENLLRILIRADGGRRGGLLPPWLGPESELRPLYAAAYTDRVLVQLALVILGVTTGSMALALWLTQSRRDSSGRQHRDAVYLLGALAQLGWALRMSDPLVQYPMLPWPAWGIFMGCVYNLTVAALVAFGLLVIRFPQDRRRRVLSVGLVWAMLALGCAMVTWSFLHPAPQMRRVWLTIAAVGFTGFNLACLVAAVQRATRDRLLILLAVSVTTAAAWTDWWISRVNGQYYGDAIWARYASVLFAAALAAIVTARFRAASAQARNLMETLSARVAQKEAELAASYRQLETLARDQERTAERARILRDMHDGVGSHISAAIRQLQSGRASNAEVLLTLRDSLDQLKLSIDAMNMPPGDVTALLANLRYRLEPRFAASDVVLEWDVDLLPTLPQLDANAMRQLQYMLFEALSNVLQHAQAHVLRIEATAGEGGAVSVRVVDDGRGFDVAAPVRKGLASMRERASAIGAAVHLSSVPGRTVVEIRLG